MTKNSEHARGLLVTVAGDDYILGFIDFVGLIVYRLVGTIDKQTTPNSDVLMS
jgi:hypothetical protein